MNRVLVCESGGKMIWSVFDEIRWQARYRAALALLALKVAVCKTKGARTDREARAVCHRDRSSWAIGCTSASGRYLRVDAQVSGTEQ